MGTKSQQIVGGLVCIALAAVILTPLALSSSDLIRWAKSPDGLGVGGPWPYLVFIGLDCAAVVCVGMTIIAAWRGESGGAFHFLTWVFAGGSALANYSHGLTTPAPHDEFFFPAMSLAGPLLLDVVLQRVRRWIREGNRHQLASHAKFGVRWLVAFRETHQAWVISRRDGISEPMAAIAMVRERRALGRRSAEECLRFARMALPDASAWQLHQWLLARGVEVGQDALDRVVVSSAVVLPTVGVGDVEHGGGPVLPVLGAGSGLVEEMRVDQAVVSGSVEEMRVGVGDGGEESMGFGTERVLGSDPVGVEPERSGGRVGVEAVRRGRSGASSSGEPAGVRRARRPAVVVVDAGELVGLSDEELRSKVAAQTKRGRARLALEISDNDVLAGLEWLRRLGFDGPDLPDRSEMYKVRSILAEGSAGALRSPVSVL